MLFFFNDTAPAVIYTLSLHDALPISNPPRSRGATDRPTPLVRGDPTAISWLSTSKRQRFQRVRSRAARIWGTGREFPRNRDRKSTRLNSSHSQISYAVFCLKKKRKNA